MFNIVRPVLSLLLGAVLALTPTARAELPDDPNLPAFSASDVCLLGGVGTVDSRFDEPLSAQLSATVAARMRAGGVAMPPQNSCVVTGVPVVTAWAVGNRYAFTVSLTLLLDHARITQTRTRAGVDHPGLFSLTDPAVYTTELRGTAASRAELGRAVQPVASRLIDGFVQDWKRTH